MLLRLVIALLGMVAVTTAAKETDDCHACVNGVCYEINKLEGDYDRFPIKQFAVDRVDNLVYFSYLYSFEIRTLNLTDKTTKTVVTTEPYTVLELTVYQATRDLYYILKNGDFYKYNLESKQKVALLDPDRSRSLYNLFFISNKLYAMMASRSTTWYPKLYEYVPEKSQFKLFEPLKDFEERLIEEPFADSRGDIYFKYVASLYKLPAGSNSTTLISRGIGLLDGIGEIKVYAADKDGVAYFISEFGEKIFRLAPYSNEFQLVGAIDSKIINSINFDKYNNILYVDIGLRYLTATAVSCKVIPRGLLSVEIVKDKI